MKRIPRSILIVLFLISTVFVVPALAQDVEALDGETIILDGSVYVLQGVDAPHIEQFCLFRNRLFPCGQTAKDALTDLIARRLVRCREIEKIYKDPSDYHPNDAVNVAFCTANGYDLSESMVYAGWALAHPESGERYSATEVKARNAERGLWRGVFVMPWEWRAGARLPQESGTDLTN